MWKHKTFIGLTLIMILAAGIRFFRMYDLAVFLADQAYDSTQVLNILRGDFTLLGPISSVGGFYNGPIVYYLMLPFFWILNADPISGTVFQTCLSVATIPLIYLIGKKLKNAQVGLIASFLFAISPLMVEYSRAAFNSFPAIFFSTLIIYAYLHLLEKFSLKKILCIGILLGFVVQMHYLTIALVGLVFLYPPFFQKKLVSFKYYFLLILGIVIGFSPFLLFEVKHQFFNTKLILQYFTSTKNSTEPRSLFYIFQVWPELAAKLLAGENFIGGLLVSVVTLVTFIAIYTKKTIQRMHSHLSSLLFSLVFLIGLVFGKKMQLHYVISFHTSFILLFALTLDYLFQGKKLLIAMVCLFLLFINAWHWNYDKTKHPIQFGLSITDFKNAASLIHADTKSRYNVAMHAEGDNRAMPLRYTLNLLHETPMTYEDYAGAQTLYFILPKKENVPDQTMWEYTSFGASRISKKWDVNNQYYLYKLIKK